MSEVMQVGICHRLCGDMSAGGSISGGLKKGVVAEPIVNSPCVVVARCGFAQAYSLKSRHWRH